MGKLFDIKYNTEPHRMHWWHYVLLVALIAGTIYAAHEYNATTATEPASGATYEAWRCEGSVFGTFYHITYNGATDLQPAIDSTLAAVDASLSPFNPHSTITALNENTSARTDEHFRRVFTLAQRISTATNGAFDITVAPLVNAWGFGFKNEAQLSDTLIDRLRESVGYDKVRLEADTIVKQRATVQMDCSAIAKGYGVDAVARMFVERHITDFMVEVGGEVRVSGTNPDGRPWSVGISTPQDDPTGSNNALQDVVQITNIAMATSGNYRNFYEREGKRYAHTIDPRTGRPVQHTLLSATVIADDCATADAYATAFMVMGLEKARTFLTTHPELKAYFIYATDKGNATWHTEGLHLRR